MILALDENGEIGRKVPGPGLKAKIYKADLADRRGNVYVSKGQIQSDQAHWNAEEQKSIAMAHAEAMKNKLKKEVEVIEQHEKAKKTLEFHKNKKTDPLTEQLRSYYNLQSVMSESEKSVRSLSPAHLPSAPADFSASGGNVEYVRGEEMTGGTDWRADFRDRLIVGNPLTRDGVYGPDVTDFDRLVRGIDINQWNVVDERTMVGGTMLGRLDGENKPMGDFFENLWSGVQTGVQQGVTSAVAKIPGQVSTVINSELQKLIDQGKAKVENGQVVVYQQAPPTIISQAAQVPTWAWVAGGLAVTGLFAVLLLRK